MGESKGKLKEVAVAAKQVLDNPAHDNIPMSVVTPGGRIQVRWDTRECDSDGTVGFFCRIS